MNERTLRLMAIGHERVMPVAAAALTALVVSLLPGSAEAARKEFWHDIRHDFISAQYVYGTQIENPRIRLFGPGQASTETNPRYRLAYEDELRGWRLRLAFDMNNWFGVHLASLRTERGLTLRSLEYTTTAGQASSTVSFGDENYNGELVSTTTDYGLTFHTPGRVFSFIAGAAYSMVSNSFTLNGTNLRLTHQNQRRIPDDDRHGWVGWSGIRLRMGDRWEMDAHFYQSLYDDFYDEVSRGEFGLAFSPAPKTEIRYTAFYEINSQTVLNELGFRIYF